MTLTALGSLGEWAEAIDTSFHQPLLVFKHSCSCGRSQAALQIVRAALAARHAPTIAVMVTVQTDPHVSRQIEADLAVRHETPQVFLVCKGRAVWHAAHFSITTAALQAALESKCVL